MTKDAARILHTGATANLCFAYELQKNFQLQNYQFSGTGQVGYALVPMVARGLTLGPDQPVILHLLGRSAGSLKGVEMELISRCLPPLLLCSNQIF
ncbi:hypothetical protein POTOM_010328 [Populus tomentosa]|uniref:Uncharacterized protein n=1 Tax=Populus tomentosa TaxID=118781 RepID=A0A8X8APK5_POPTO|nr:hypothetical protein POTOM_010328 [Populus tomentosa]